MVAALSLFQLRNLLNTVIAISKLKASAVAGSPLAAVFEFSKPALQQVAAFAEEAFGGASLSHLKSLTLTHYLQLALVFAIFSLMAMLREGSRGRSTYESQRAAAAQKEKDD